jgi:uncharacterized protein (DUF2147 family)
LRRLALLGCAWLWSCAALGAEADRILGLWYTAKDDAQVRIEAAPGGYTGTIVWLKEPQFPADDPQGMAGRDKVDRENPDASQRQRPIIGLRIMQGFRFDGTEWVDGRIYDPENGKTYKCRMWFGPDGRLHVRGFIGFSLLGRTTEWRRVP